MWFIQTSDVVWIGGFELPLSTPCTSGFPTPSALVSTSVLFLLQNTVNYAMLQDIFLFLPVPTILGIPPSLLPRIDFLYPFFLVTAPLYPLHFGGQSCHISYICAMLRACLHGGSVTLLEGAPS